jgi:hypothetical protein
VPPAPQRCRERVGHFKLTRIGNVVGRGWGWGNPPDCCVPRLLPVNGHLKSNIEPHLGESGSMAARQVHPGIPRGVGCCADSFLPPTRITAVEAIDAPARECQVADYPSDSRHSRPSSAGRRPPKTRPIHLPWSDLRPHLGRHSHLAQLLQPLRPSRSNSFSQATGAPQNDHDPLRRRQPEHPRILQT